METVAIRYFNVFGPRQDPLSQYAAVIPRFITALLAGEAPVVFGDGEQSRDFTYIDNVVEANLLAAAADGCLRRRSTSPAVSGSASIICSTSFGDYRHGGRANHPEPRSGDGKHSLADISRAQKMLGYRPVIEFSEGLRRTVEHHQGHASPSQVGAVLT